MFTRLSTDWMCSSLYVCLSFFLPLPPSSCCFFLVSMFCLLNRSLCAFIHSHMCVSVAMDLVPRPWKYVEYPRTPSHATVRCTYSHTYVCTHMQVGMYICMCMFCSRSIWDFWCICTIYACMYVCTQKCEYECIFFIRLGFAIAMPYLCLSGYVCMYECCTYIHCIFMLLHASVGRNVVLSVCLFARLYLSLLAQWFLHCGFLFVWLGFSTSIHVSSKNKTQQMLKTKRTHKKTIGLSA